MLNIDKDKLHDKERRKKNDAMSRTSTRNHDIYAHTTLYKLCEFKYITEFK